MERATRRKRRSHSRDAATTCIAKSRAKALRFTTNAFQGTVGGREPRMSNHVSLEKALIGARPLLSHDESSFCMRWKFMPVPNGRRARSRDGF